MDDELSGAYWVHGDVHARVNVSGPNEHRQFNEPVYYVSFYAHGLGGRPKWSQYMTAGEVRQRIGREWEPIRPE